MMVVFVTPWTGHQAHNGGGRFVTLFCHCVNKL